MPRLTCILFLMLTTACEPDGETTTSDSDTATGAGTADDTETSTGATTGTAGTAGTSSTGDTETSGESTGGGTGGGGGVFEGTGVCVAFGPSVCTVTSDGWCADLLSLCKTTDVSANATYCAALDAACQGSTLTPCTICKEAWGECVRHGGDVLDPQCETFGETCACLAEGHGVV